MINSKDIKKHRNDVLKLIAGTDFSEIMTVEPPIWEAIQAFAQLIEEQLSTNPKSLKDALGRTTEQIRIYLDILRSSFIQK